VRLEQTSRDVKMRHSHSRRSNFVQIVIATETRTMRPIRIYVLPVNGNRISSLSRDLHRSLRAHKRVSAATASLIQRALEETRM